MKEYLLDRLKEPSTWRGIVLLLTSLGIGMNPEQQQSLIVTGLMLAGFISATTKG